MQTQPVARVNAINKGSFHRDVRKHMPMIPKKECISANVLCLEHGRANKSWFEVCGSTKSERVARLLI
jgi:hypothetical protein